MKFRVESDDWIQDGEKINAPEAIETIRQCLEERGPIILEHWFYRGSCSPARLIFEDLDEILAYLTSKARPGDAFSIYDYGAVCRDDNMLVRGKYPDLDGCVPRKGAY